MENGVREVVLVDFVKKYKDLGLGIEDICRLWHFQKLQGVIRLSADDLDNITSIYNTKSIEKLPVVATKKLK